MPGRRAVVRGLLAAGCVVVVAGGVAAASPGLLRAGPRPDGTAVIPIGYRVTPAGAQSRLGDLPLTVRAFPDGKAALVVNAGQGQQSVQVVDPGTGGVLQTIGYPAPQALFVGAAFSPDGTRAYVSAGGNNKIRTYSVSGDRLTETAPIALPTTNPAGVPVNLYPADLAPTPDGRRLVVADQVADAATVVDVVTGASRTVAVGHAPYGIAVSADGRSAYVTNQGAATVSVLDITGTAPVVRATVPVGTHPNRIVADARRHLAYVADGDADTVSVIDTSTDAVVRTIALSPYAGAQVGSNPDALALDRDGNTLYVANSGNNDVAVVDAGPGRIRGLIPTAWYPSSLAMMVGTLSRISLPVPEDQLRAWTRQVNGNDGFDRRDDREAAAASSIVPRRLGEHSPIQHVIYIVKENRTFDQEFGSLGRGAGDASGWNWVVAGNSNNYTEQTWVANYSGRNHGYPSESNDPAIAPQRPDDAYIWQRLARSHVPRRYHAGRADAAGLRRRQRLGARAARRRGVAFEVLEVDGDLRHRGRRAERSRPHRRAPDPGAGDQPVHPDRAGRLDLLQHRLDAAHHRAALGTAAAHPVRRLRHADDRLPQHHIWPVAPAAPAAPAGKPAGGDDD